MDDAKIETFDAPVVFVVADLARLQIDSVKTLARRRILAVADEREQVNLTRAAAIGDALGQARLTAFHAFTEATLAHGRALRARLAEVGAVWNPVPTRNQDELDAKDEGYNTALAAIDVQAGWPVFGGWPQGGMALPEQEADLPPSDIGREIEHEGRTYRLMPADALGLFGALVMAMDGETARVRLASGDVLELTHQQVSHIGRQLGAG
jgi:hypothetical protein